MANVGSAGHTGASSLTSSLNRLVALVFGIIYLLVAVLGFIVVGGGSFISRTGPELLGVFQINHLHNIVHLLVGGLLTAAALKGVAAARSANIAVGAVYLLVGILGFLIQRTGLNILALNTPDHFLHLASAAVLLGVGLTQDKAHAGTSARGI